MRIWIQTAIAVIAMFIACTETPKQPMGAAVDNDKNVLTGGPITGTTVNDLPPAVKETLWERVPHAEIATIEKSRSDGRLVYEFNFTEPDRHPTLYIRKDGVVVPQPSTAAR